MYIKKWSMVLFSFIVLSIHADNHKVSALTKLKHGIIPSSWEIPLGTMVLAGVVKNQLYVINMVRMRAHQRMLGVRTLLVPAMLTCFSVAAIKSCMPGGILQKRTENGIVTAARDLKKEIITFTKNGTILSSDSNESIE